MSSELYTYWKVYKENIFKLIFITTIQVLLIQIMDIFPNLLINNVILYSIVKVGFFLFKLFLNSISLLLIIYITYDYYKLQQVNLINIFKRILDDFKQILIIISLELLIIVIFSVPLISLIFLGLKLLLIFIWQSYVIGNNKAINVFKDSVLLVIYNIRDLIQYILLYIGIYILFILLDFKYESYNVLNFIFKYLYQLLYTFIVILFTYLYIKYSKNNLSSS